MAAIEAPWLADGAALPPREAARRPAGALEAALPAARAEEGPVAGEADFPRGRGDEP